MSALSLSPGVNYTTPFERPPRHEASQIPTPDQAAPATVLPPALTEEQITTFRYLGFGIALRRLINGNGIDQAAFAGPTLAKRV